MAHSVKVTSIIASSPSAHLTIKLATEPLVALCRRRRLRACLPLALDASSSSPRSALGHVRRCALNAAEHEHGPASAEDKHEPPSAAGVAHPRDLLKISFSLLKISLDLL
jgi:hypothetical protein